ncbi:hypothetical protein Daura_00230 [Dactylosporangium aurantiacum]|uniref:Uncharacterized protein n=1 Tax=Dactylosporangium aurantiacum TaxID=35754 RepID=A0A9Q9IIX8_9ACTN|nr:hypothetical protein [Dactylosporangium aurantiacum]MDG6101207.1 hypothetical protein [Dactylosporangium aurantiacum]UWZ54772.1 hypothetical protein Daura_00230 [Dactylosporangium aurantiacum]
MSDPLHTGLSEIADKVAPADLLDRSLRRSRRIGQRRAMAAAGGVTLAVVAAVGVTLGVNGPDRPSPGPEISATAAPSPPVLPSSAPPSSPSVPSSSPPVAGSVAGLPGWLYYQPAAGSSGTTTLARLDGGRLVPVASGVDFPTVSPDGTAIAALDGDRVVITDRDGKHRRHLGSGLAGVGYEPAWSPAGDRILVAGGPADSRPRYGVLTVATGAFTPLPHDPGGIHYLWSGDGKRLGYATGECRIGVADADGGNARLVPTVRSCDPFSLSPDGSMIAVDVILPGQDAGDIGPNRTADAIIDTSTGKAVTLPVTGAVTQILFGSDGTILVRASRPGGTTLTLLAADRSVRTTVTEPAVAKGWLLAGYR